jgi:superoxide reductase
MQRRDFAKSAIFGLAATTALPVAVMAAEGDPNENVLFTESNPGHWAKVVASHTPQASVADGKVTIKTPHGQSETHYIVSHSVVLASGAFVSRKTFTYQDEPVSEHVLPAGYKGKVTITSTCNQHDYWVATISV